MKQDKTKSASASGGTLSSKGLLHFRDASAAQSLALVFHQCHVASAKQAGGLELTQDDAIVFGEKLDLVAAVDVHFAAHFLREDQAAHLVNDSYNSGVLHRGVLSLLGFMLMPPKDPFLRGLTIVAQKHGGVKKKL